MISLDENDWEVGRIPDDKFKHHFYLTDDPRITLEVDINKVCHSTVGEYSQHKEGYRTIMVNFLHSGYVFCERKVVVYENNGYTVLPVTTKEPRNDILVIQQDDGPVDVKFDLYYEIDELLLAQMLTYLIIDSINKKQAMNGNLVERSEYKDYESVFKQFKHTSMASGNVYYLISINGDLYTDRDRKSIDNSIEWED